MYFDIYLLSVSVHILCRLYVYSKISSFQLNISCYCYHDSTIRIQVPHSFESHFITNNYEQRIERRHERHEKLCMTDPGATAITNSNGARGTNATLSHSISTPWRARQKCKMKDALRYFGISRVKEPRRARVVLTWASSNATGVNLFWRVRTWGVYASPSLFVPREWVPEISRRRRTSFSRPTGAGNSRPTRGANDPQPVYSVASLRRKPETDAELSRMLLFRRFGVDLLPRNANAVAMHLLPH